MEQGQAISAQNLLYLRFPYSAAECLEDSILLQITKEDFESNLKRTITAAKEIILNHVNNAFPGIAQGTNGEIIAETGKMILVNKGEIIFEEGTIAYKLYILLDGEVALSAMQDGTIGIKVGDGTTSFEGLNCCSPDSDSISTAFKVILSIFIVLIGLLITI